MYCSNCGVELSSGWKYCPQCGAATGEGGIPFNNGRTGRTLVRLREDRQIAGVCAGLARYLGVDVTLVRVLVVCLSIWPPLVGLIFYVICWIVVPNEPLLLMPPANRTAADPSTTNVV
jgi:phage shock protein C